MLDFAVNACGFHKLTATVTAGNLASRGLLESCGFQLEGTLRDNYRLAGQWCDDWLFGLLAAEFQAANKNIAPGIDKLVGAALCSIFGQFAGLRRSDGPGANVYRGIPYG